MNAKDSDADSQMNLDVEFRRILRIIKPYIPCVMNNDYLTFYRLWLEKLNDTESSEKRERNRYLMELCYQIQDGILEHPFTQLPVPGPLPPFNNESRASKMQIEEERMLGNFNFVRGKPPKVPEATNGQATNSKDKFEPPVNVQTGTSSNNTREIAKLEQNFRNANNNESAKLGLKNGMARRPYKKRNEHILLKNIRPPPVLNQNVIGDFCLSSPKPVENTYPSSPHFQQAEIVTKPNFMKSPVQYATNKNYLQLLQILSPQIRSQNTSPQKGNYEDDESSWLDLSETSYTTGATKIASGDSDTSPTPTARTENNIEDKAYEMYENRILDLMNTINALQKQNVSLNEDVTKFEQDLTLKNTKAETSIHNLACEVNSLKSRLQELTDIKMAVKNSQLAASTQWEKTANSLRKELQKAQTSNAELKAEVAVLQKRLEDFSSQRQKDNTALRQKLAEMHSKEIDMLKRNHAGRMSDIENKYLKKLNEFKDEYENKISKINEEHKKIEIEKNAEIQRLEIMINTQCKQMHEEVSKMRNKMDGNSCVSTDENFNKVILLQKCVARMDRLFKKSEKHFTKQISKLKHEIELRDKIIQIQLSAQRGELYANTNVVPVDVDATVVELEERYKKLLEAQQAHFLAEKKQDCKLISELRAAVAKNSMNN